MTTNSQQRWIHIGEIDEFARLNCKMKDPLRVEKLLNEIVKGGPNELQVVTDFDFTLTKQKKDDGEPCHSSFGMLEDCQALPESFLSKSKELYNRFRPLEICPNLSQEKKRELMIDWWILSEELYKGFKLNPKQIEDHLSNDKSFQHMFRDGAHEFLQLTDEKNVPVLVFSAGLGDTIITVMKQEKILYKNIKVVSNFLKYEDGYVNGFSDEYPLIHTYNKNETVLEGTEYYDMVHNRQHVILMGDSLGDAGMAEGVPKTSSVLKIGFLFDHPEINLSKYMDTFDIVLVDDQTMDIPRKILSLVIEQGCD